VAAASHAEAASTGFDADMVTDKVGGHHRGGACIGREACTGVRPQDKWVEAGTNLLISYSCTKP
jgi:hypothetical protein